MSEQEVTTPIEEVTPEQQQQVNIPPLSQDQVDQMKKIMCDNLLKAYQDFILAISHIPVEQRAMYKGVEFLDTGFLWVKEAILKLPIQSMQPVNDPVSAEPVDAPQPTDVA